MALQSQAVVVGWQVYALTHSPFLLGLTGLAEALPALVCALFAGHLVDVGNPRRIYRLCVAALCANTLLLMLVAGGHTDAPASVIVPTLFAGVFFSGMARSFVMPSGFTLLSQYVPRDRLAAAAACLNAGFQIAAIGGPAMAGLLYGFHGAGVAWLLPAGALLAATLATARLGAFTRAKPPAREPAWKSIREGWRYIFGNQVLLSVMALDMFAVLFGGATAMLPAFADQILHVGPEGLGFLRAAPAIGSITMALMLAMRPLRILSGRLLLGVFAGFGLSMIGFGLSRDFLLSLLCLAASGMFDSVNVIIRTTMVQLLTPDDMKGRISSVNTMFVISSNEIGAFESGVAAKLLGLVPSVVFGGIMSLAVVALISFCSPKLRSAVIDTRA